MPFRKKFRRSFRRKPLMRVPAPDVVPLNLCNVPTFLELSTAQGQNLDDLCSSMEPDEAQVPVVTGTVLLDGGQFSLLGDAIQGMTKGLKFKGLNAQYDFMAAGRTHATMQVIYHGVFKVNITSFATSGRFPAWLPNPMSKSDVEVGDCLWRHVDKFFVPQGVAGVSNGWANSVAGWCSNIVEPGAGSNLADAAVPFKCASSMSIRTKRNLREDECLVWCIAGYIFDLVDGVTIVESSGRNHANLYGRMAVSNWQS